MGAILGQQNGREVTMEVAFACKMLAQAGEGSYSIDDEWFRDRLEQCMHIVARFPLRSGVVAVTMAIICLRADEHG